MEILDTAHPVLPSLDLNFPDCQIGETFQVSFERGGGGRILCVEFQQFPPSAIRIVSGDFGGNVLMWDLTFQNQNG